MSEFDKNFTPTGRGIAPRGPITRRGVLTIAAGAGVAGCLAEWSPLQAFSSDFWNKKDPSEWSSEEVSQLTSKSPWAKEVGGNYTSSGGQSRGMGGGGMGGGGMGGGGRRRGQVGMPSQNYKGTIRWESATPILDALKTPLADTFKDHYVISVTGFPLDNNGGRSRSQSEDSNASLQDALDHLKSVTFLQPKTKRDVQPGIVQQPANGRYGSTVLFGFSKEVLALQPEDKEVTFITSFGRLDLKAKFNLKEMVYRGELAV
jgi:hypothetical protein